MPRGCHVRAGLNRWARTINLSSGSSRRSKPKWMAAAQWKQPAGLAPGAGSAPDDPAARIPARDADDCDHAAGPEEVSGRRLFALRLRRWDVETDIRHLKTTMGMDILHCKTAEGVQKELWMFLLVYNLVRAVMLAAAKRQKVPVDRISFASALHWMRRAETGAVLPRLAVVPHRPNRMEPRVKKRRPKQYDLMVRPRKIMRNELRAAIGEFQLEGT